MTVSEAGISGRNGLTAMNLEWIHRLVGFAKIGLGLLIAAALIWRTHSYRETVTGYEMLAPAMLTISAVLVLLTVIALLPARHEAAEQTHA
jgi:heme A synthase